MTGDMGRLDRLEALVNTTAISVATITANVQAITDAQARAAVTAEGFVLREVYLADRRLLDGHEAALVDLENRMRGCEKDRAAYVTQRTLWVFAAGIVAATGTIVGIIERLTA